MLSTSIPVFKYNTHAPVGTGAALITEITEPELINEPTEDVSAGFSKSELSLLYKSE